MTRINNCGGNCATCGKCNNATTPIRVKYPRYLSDKTHVHIQNGNTKVGKGVYTINLMPGRGYLTTKDGTVLTNVAGTCDGCCENCENDCYAIRDGKFRQNTCMPAWGDNTLLARYDLPRFVSEIQAFLDNNIVSVVRFHAMGEIPFERYIPDCLIKIANDNPTTLFYIYTKRFDLIEKYAAEIPANLVVNVSIWHKNYDNPCNFPEFIYDDGTEPELARLPHCPAVDKTGHETGMTCARCRHCFKARNGQKMAVYAH